MVAFTLETNDKTILLSSDCVGASEWVQKLCELSFPDKEPTDHAISSSLEMSVNSLYMSREDVSEFEVTVQRTEAAERCSLHGSYLLKTESDCLLLKDPNTKETLYSWPYKLLRRYGRDKVMFSFEAGRRCSSGAGNFTFETSQGHEIFQRVESSIRAQQGSENRLSCPTLDADCTIDVSDVSSESSVPEAPNKSGPVRKDPEEKPLKGRTLPNLPGSKSVAPQLLLDHSGLGANSGSSHTPPCSPVSRSASRHLEVDHEQLVGVYSEPKDSVKVIKPHFDPLYSDPVDCVAGKVLKGERSKLDPSERSPLYSDLYEHVGYETVGATVCVPHAGEEHIYDEPEGMAQAPQVYSELGYEYPYNPNTDDYSVPNFQGQRGQGRSRGLGPKPVPAPKPQGIVIARTVTGKEGGECGFSNSTINNNNNSNLEAIYSQVHKKEAAKCATQHTCHSLPSIPSPTLPYSVPSRPLQVPPPAKSVLSAPHSTKLPPAMPLPAMPLLPKHHSATAPPRVKPQTAALQPSSAPPRQV
ncbi:hypothetical protein XELAEV_18008649mg [Xenopus laevis]|uniref:IRS-type PTB domain-containing protein n=1 Tax=Xenopus laevis TaxID=8355 RepID=A0A974DR28_XENLA|nr:hypothetical protein XELAEV_18008649mg [Xenopus laevis]